MSLQRRLVAVMSILLVAGLLVADIVTYVSVRSFLYGRADETLSSSEGLAFNYVVYSHEHRVALSEADLTRHVSPDVYVVVLNHAGKEIVRRPSGSPAHPDPARPAGCSRSTTRPWQSSASNLPITPANAEPPG